MAEEQLLQDCAAKERDLIELFCQVKSKLEVDRQRVAQAIADTSSVNLPRLYNLRGIQKRVEKELTDVDRRRAVAATLIEDVRRPARELRDELRNLQRLEKAKQDSGKRLIDLNREIAAAEQATSARELQRNATNATLSTAVTAATSSGNMKILAADQIALRSELTNCRRLINDLQDRVRLLRENVKGGKEALRSAESALQDATDRVEALRAHRTAAVPTPIGATPQKEIEVPIREYSLGVLQKLKGDLEQLVEDIDVVKYDLVDEDAKLRQEMATYNTLVEEISKRRASTIALNTIASLELAKLVGQRDALIDSTKKRRLELASQKAQLESMEHEQKRLERSIRREEAKTPLVQQPYPAAAADLGAASQPCSDAKAHMDAAVELLEKQKAAELVLQRAAAALTNATSELRDTHASLHTEEDNELKINIRLKDVERRLEVENLAVTHYSTVVPKAESSYHRAASDWRVAHRSMFDLRLEKQQLTFDAERREEALKRCQTQMVDLRRELEVACSGMRSTMTELQAFARRYLHEIDVVTYEPPAEYTERKVTQLCNSTGTAPAAVHDTTN